MSKLASMYWNQGRSARGSSDGTRKRVLGGEHPDTPASMASLAPIWKAQGRDPEALSPMMECTMLQEPVLEADRPSFVSSSNALAD